MIAPVSEPIEISQVTPPILRWVLVAIGGFVAIIATTELWRAIWPLSIVTPFFGLILAMAVWIGTKLVFGSAFGPDEHWRFEPGHLRIRRTLRGRETEHHYRTQDIASTMLETSDWDSRPATYFLAIRLLSGQAIKSPEFGTEAKARAAMARLGW